MGEVSVIALLELASIPLRKLRSEELDVFQLVHNYGKVSEVLDRAPSGDLDVANTLSDLIDKGYISKA